MPTKIEALVTALEQYSAAHQAFNEARWPEIKEALLEFYRRYRGQPEVVKPVESLARQMGLNKTD